jgi:hypothetical protein
MKDSTDKCGYMAFARWASLLTNGAFETTAVAAIMELESKTSFLFIIWSRQAPSSYIHRYIKDIP